MAKKIIKVTFIGGMEFNMKNANESLQETFEDWLNGPNQNGTFTYNIEGGSTTIMKHSAIAMAEFISYP